MKTPVFKHATDFLYPTSTRYPFDVIISKIVKAIEARNWNVDGLELKFDTYGKGEAKYQMVRDINGTDFKLHFSRKQGNLEGGWNNIAAASTISIPKEILTVYCDESGPSYYLYVGKDWEADKGQLKRLAVFRPPRVGAQ